MNEAANKTNDVSFKAEKFVQLLLTEGGEIPCDDTNEQFRTGGDLPPDFDEEKFKRGQRLFHRHIFGMLLAKLMGLIAILAVPSILSILKFTKMSSEPVTAYKRYMATMFHMIVWYDKDFKPGSNLWRSIEEVKGKHGFASKRSCAAGLNRITQTDMALTQFGFMGFMVSKPRCFGVFDGSEDDFAAFVYVWRVMGRLVGIEDRFNICRESLHETREICNELITKVFKRRVEEQRDDFIEMSRMLNEGMWCMMPMLNPPVFMTFLIKLVNGEDGGEVFKKNYATLSKTNVIYLWFVEQTMYTYRFTLLRWYHNIVMYVSLWLMHVFPFLAFYKFGKENSFVSIMNGTGYARKNG